MEDKKPEFKRIDYIDYLRGWAVIFMIFWHSIDALLSVTYKHSFIFSIAQFMGGLVAPSFLFTAGAAFSIILFKRRGDLLSFSAPARKQLRRILQILIIAYLLHFPFNMFVKLKFEMTYEQYLNFIKIDVLHVIALGLFLMQVIFLLVRKEIRLYYILIISSLCFVIFTPSIYQMDFSRVLPVEVATFINKKYYSLFPVFPWMAYLFLGSIVMSLILNFNKAGKEIKIINILLFLGIFLVIVGLIPELLSIRTTPYYDFWFTSPNIFCIKIGIIFILIKLFRSLANIYKYKMKIFAIFSRESLFVYVVHLLLVYGKDSPITLERYFGNSLNWPEYFMVYALLLGLMLVVAKNWNKIKAKRDVVRSR
jgi:uncharacterized membrane protein